MDQIRGHVCHSLLGYHVSGRHDATPAAAATLHAISRQQHEACSSLTIYFMPSLHYLLASFHHISFTLTEVVGNLVALWRKLQSGAKNTFSFGGNNLSLSSEINPVRQSMWKRVGDKGEGKNKAICIMHPVSLCPFTPLLFWCVCLHLLSTDFQKPTRVALLFFCVSPERTEMKMFCYTSFVCCF